MLLLPVAVGSVAGLVDGYVVSTDEKAGRTQIAKQHQVWYRAGLIVAGVVVDLAHVVSEPVAESLIVTGTSLLASRAGVALGKGFQHPAATGGGVTASLPPGTRRRLPYSASRATALG